MWKRKEKIRTKKVSFFDIIHEMIEFFDGFEYGESVVRINKIDYMRYMQYFTIINGKPYIAGMLVYVDPTVSQGKIFLDSIHAIQEARESA